jgi:hypothetical protein
MKNFSGSRHFPIQKKIDWLIKRLPPVERIWRRSEPDFYGASYLIAKQIGKKKPPVSFAAWSHGCFFLKSVIHPRFILALGSKKMMNLVGTVQQASLLKEFDYKKVKAVGLPYIYADTIKLERKKGSLLVMPGHTLPYTEQHLDQKFYVDEIVKLKPYFSTIVACVHSACVKHGYWIEEFEKNGIPWIQGADTFDKNALIRINALFKSFEYMTTNKLGAHVAYASYSGAKVSIFGPYASPRIGDSKMDPSFKPYPELMKMYFDSQQENAIRFHYPELFTHPLEAPLRKAWGAKMIGSENKRSSQEIAELLGWSLASQILGYCKEGLRLASSPSTLRSLLERRRIAKQS